MAISHGWERVCRCRRGWRRRWRPACGEAWAALAAVWGSGLSSEATEDLIDFSIPCPEDTHPNVGSCPGHGLIVFPQPLIRIEDILGVAAKVGLGDKFWTPAHLIFRRLLTPDSWNQLGWSATAPVQNLDKKQLIFENKHKMFSFSPHSKSKEAVVTKTLWVFCQHFLTPVYAKYQTLYSAKLPWYQNWTNYFILVNVMIWTRIENYQSLSP